jgi:AcrR family transcriptional regulator
MVPISPPSPTRPRRGRPPKAKGGDVSAREAILDAAEGLFSQHGFHGVTLREVAREAGVDTALLHYYFESKRGLFDAVFLRRAEPLNRERMQALDRVMRESDGRPSVEDAIRAFVEPPLRWSATGGPGWKHYCALIAQANANPVWGGETMARFFDPVVHRLIEVIRAALPEAENADLYWAYHNLSAALTLTMGETGRLDRLSDGLCRSGDLATAQAKMIVFAAAGFRAVCAR